ncbi:Sperm-associated antigen 6 [Sciurus carolinensis]|uniref:Sperm-associated antigen 6 n=1 Tax=Sciurus carolinensis TaxID=30640 RepID=A0AA41SR09_SCICA|nr:Sperm-associated antigen 6 [Sciurus carolinensis]
MGKLRGAEKCDKMTPTLRSLFLHYKLSQAVVDAGAVPLLVLCIQEPEIALKRIAASTLSDISKHSPELAQTVVDAGAIAHLAQMILSPDAKLKRQILSALSQIAKHSVDLAEMVVEAEIFPVVLTCLKDKDDYVKKNASTLIREIAKHTPELAQLIVNAGGVAAVIDCVGSCKGNIRLPGIMMLGYVAAHSENLAMAVIISKGVPQLSICLSEEPEDHIKAAAAWALGQIGRHTPEHARAVAVTNTLPVLLSLYMSPESSEDLQVKSKKAIKSILQKCTYLPALEPFLYDAPPNILKHVVGQFSKVLPHDSKARRLFVTSGGLKKVQEIKAEPGSLLQEYINSINNCYPEEITTVKGVLRVQACGREPDIHGGHAVIIAEDLSGLWKWKGRGTDGPGVCSPGPYYLKEWSLAMEKSQRRPNRYFLPWQSVDPTGFSCQQLSQWSQQGL